jgi:hypothetical protein
MPVNIYVSDNKRVVHMDYSDPWSITDLVDTFPLQKELCTKLSGPLAVIVNMEKTSHIPTGVMRARQAPLLKSSLVEQIIAVGGPVVARVLGDTVLRIAHYKNARFVATKDEAIRCLRKDFSNGSDELAAPHS